MDEAVTAVIEKAEQAGARLGVAAALPGGTRFAHRGGERFVAASTVKIAIMAELFRRVDAGAVSLDDRHVLRAEDKAGGSGVVAALHDGIGFTLGDLAYLMMSISDNSATNILIDRLGMGRVNALMQELGMAGSTLGRRMRGSHATTPAEENWAVPEEYVRTVAAILDGRAASAGSCARMVALLEGQQNERRIARHLPREGRPRWGSKTGSLPGVTNDVGFVTTAQGPVVMAIFCADVHDPLEGERIVGDVAGALLEGAHLSAT